MTKVTGCIPKIHRSSNQLSDLCIPIFHKTIFHCRCSFPSCNLMAPMGRMYDTRMGNKPPKMTKKNYLEAEEPGLEVI